MHQNIYFETAFITLNKGIINFSIGFLPLVVIVMIPTLKAPAELIKADIKTFYHSLKSPPKRYGDLIHMLLQKDL